MGTSHGTAAAKVVEMPVAAAFLDRHLGIMHEKLEGPEGLRGLQRWMIRTAVRDNDLATLRWLWDAGVGLDRSTLFVVEDNLARLDPSVVQTLYFMCVDCRTAEDLVVVPACQQGLGDVVVHHFEHRGTAFGVKDLSARLTLEDALVTMVRHGDFEVALDGVLAHRETSRDTLKAVLRQAVLSKRTRVVKSLKRRLKQR